MPSGQRSILSFFQSPAASSSTTSSASSSTAPPSSGSSRKPPASAASMLPLASLPSRRPPPSVSKFAPPPSHARKPSTATTTPSSLPPPPPPPPPPAPSSGGRSGSRRPVQSALLLPRMAPDLAMDILMSAEGQQLRADDADNADTELIFPVPASSSPSSCRLALLRDAHVPDLVSVNSILLPVRYADSFYKNVADLGCISSLFNRVFLSRDGEVVGGVICHVEASPFEGSGDDSNPKALAVYIRSLSLLSPYRSRGLAAAALDSIVATAVALNNSSRSSSSTSTAPLLPTPIRAVFAHVWTGSDEAMHWYAARGFARQGDGPIEGYYYALKPNTAWVVRRDLGAPTATAATATTKTTEARQQNKPPPTASGLSFQHARPQMEWNDLPEDMMVLPASSSSSAPGSGASSRNASRRNLVAAAAAAASLSSASSSPPPSHANGLPPPPPPPPSSSSAAPSQPSLRGNASTRKKRERAYPAAMFGNP